MQFGRHEPVPIKRSMLLGPFLQLVVAAALARKVPTEKFIVLPYTFTGGLYARVCRAHQTLAQIFKAVKHVSRSIVAEIEILQVHPAGFDSEVGPA